MSLPVRQRVAPVRIVQVEPFLCLLYVQIAPFIIVSFTDTLERMKRGGTVRYDSLKVRVIAVLNVIAISIARLILVNVVPATHAHVGATIVKRGFVENCGTDATLVIEQIRIHRMIGSPFLPAVRQYHMDEQIVGIGAEYDTALRQRLTIAILRQGSITYKGSLSCCFLSFNPTGRNLVLLCGLQLSNDAAQFVGSGLRIGQYLLVVVGVYHEQSSCVS